MAKPAYDVQSFDLSTARTRVKIVDAGIKVDAVSVLAMPAGAAASIVLGENNKEIPISNGDSFDVSSLGPDGCPTPLDESVFLTNPAGAGTLLLLISFGEVERTTAA